MNRTVSTWNALVNGSSSVYDHGAADQRSNTNLLAEELLLAGDSRPERSLGGYLVYLVDNTPVRLSERRPRRSFLDLPGQLGFVGHNGFVAGRDGIHGSDCGRTVSLGVSVRAVPGSKTS